MTYLSPTFSTRADDYQKVRTDAVSLTNATSNRQTNLGSDRAGLGLVFPAEHIHAHNAPVTRVAFLTAEEILTGMPDDETLAQRLRDLAMNTPISLNARKQSQMFLDVNSREYTLMSQRLLQTIGAAGNNFRKEAIELLRIYDGFTQAATGQLPIASTYHIHAAFNNCDLLNRFRLAAAMPPVPAPTVTPQAREELTRRGVNVDNLPDYSEQRMLQGLLYAALPANAEKLRQQAVQKANECEKEVLIIMRALNDAMVRGTIPSFSMDDQFRRTLGQLISAAQHKPATVVAPKDVDLRYAQ